MGHQWACWAGRGRSCPDENKDRSAAEKEAHVLQVRTASMVQRQMGKIPACFTHLLWCDDHLQALGILAVIAEEGARGFGPAPAFCHSLTTVLKGGH
eukprot:1056843-Pelagomonas_calceolata.AAC.1